MKLDRLNYFESAARNESFSLAAKECHVAPSAISQQIKLLEENLGFTLFNRTNNKKIILTESGKIFYKRIKEILDLYEKAVIDAKLESKRNDTTLKIGICKSTSISLLNKGIFKLKEKFPHVEIKLISIENSECELYLLNKNCDILFTNKNLDEKYNFLRKELSYGTFGILINSTCSLYEKNYLYYNDLLSLNEHIYTLDIYKNTLLNYLPNLKEKIRTEENLSLLFASGYLNKSVIFTTYEDSKIFKIEDMYFKQLIDLPINSNNYLYYLNCSNDFLVDEFLNLL